VSNSLRAAASKLLTNRDTGSDLERTLAAELAAEPKRRQCTHRELAKQLGISPQMLSDIVHGKKRASNALLARILEE